MDERPHARSALVMAPISRRTVLIVGGAGVGAVVVGGIAAAIGTRTPVPSAPSGSPVSGSSTTSAPGALPLPTVLRSANGRLDVALTAAASAVAIGGTPVRALTYNGGLPGPTLVVRPGDVLSIALTNALPDPTNLHTHGLQVSPEGNADNVFRRVDPGETADYRIEIPAEHPPGTFWYHPHHHGMTADQVFGGLYGAILVEDGDADAAADRLMIISDIAFDAAGDVATVSMAEMMTGREGATVLVNGALRPTITARPGDIERWRIINACTSRFLDLRLDGHALQLLGIDGGRFAAPADVTGIRMMPGNRADVLVTVGEADAVLRAEPVSRGTAGMMGNQTTTGAPVTLADLVVDAAATPRPSPPPAALVAGASRDLRDAAVDRSRTLTLAMGGGMRFTIDGVAFDPSVVNHRVVAGAVEEWELVNTSTMDHPFHLHVWPMQLLRVGSSTIDGVDWRDVVEVPAGSSTVVRISFDGIVGTTVYHCHILDHEDQGMMGTIAVAEA